ncbi:MAG: hypothetical protein AB9866_29445 [Syntrophobacteraceae bacterium]
MFRAYVKRVNQGKRKLGGEGKQAREQTERANQPPMINPAHFT